MMSGRPAVYATFSSYDEVAHHSGLERADTLEALRKLDQQFGRIERARRYAPRPVRDRRPLRPRPDAGRDVQAAQRLRARRARRALARRTGRSPASPAATSRARWSATPSARRPGTKAKKRPKNDVSDRDGRRARLGQPRPRLPDGGARAGSRSRRSTRAIRACIPALRAHPHIGWLLVRSAEHGAVALGADGAHYLADGPRRGRGPARALLADRAAPPPAHRRLRARRRHHGRQLLRPEPRRGLRLRGADLASTAASAARRRARSSSTPSHLPAPDEPIVGAASVHDVLVGLAPTAPGRTRRSL